MRAGAFCWITLVLLAGCGGDGLDLAPVEGVVTFNGQPVADAGVVFSPVNPQQGPPAYGGTDEKGRFRLMTNNRAGAPLGDHRVAISKADPFGDEIPAEQLESADIVRRRGLKVFATKHYLPPHYAEVETSKLTASVQDGENYFEFVLSGK